MHSIRYTKMSAPDIDLELESIIFDDLDYLSGLVEQENVSSADIRRSSVVLRKLVYDRKLQIAASARRHKITVFVPEARALISNLERDEAAIFYQLGGFQALGIEVGCMIMERRPQPADRPYDPNITYEASLETYKKQRVFMIRANAKAESPDLTVGAISGFVSRESVIKYVAHKTGGAHYDTRRNSQDELLLDIVRKAASLSMRDGIPTFQFNSDVIDNPVARSKTPVPGVGLLEANNLDPVLLELLGAARMLVESPSIKVLKSILRT